MSSFCLSRLDLHISERIVGHLYEGQAKKTSTRRHSQSGHIDVRPDAQTVRLFTGNSLICSYDIHATTAAGARSARRRKAQTIAKEQYERKKEQSDESVTKKLRKRTRNERETHERAQKDKDSFHRRIAPDQKDSSRREVNSRRV